MKKELINRPDIKLIGISVRTNTKNEMSPQTAKIGDTVGKYFGANIANQILARKQPGVTIAVYTDYASDEHGDYTYFIGEEVSSLENLPAGLAEISIPASKYQKFTTQSGQMPEVVINAWQKIWKMSAEDLGGERTYVADFEVYDHRAIDSTNTSLDIYIGIK